MTRSCQHGPADLQRSRDRWRYAALASWLLVLLAVACGASFEQVDKLVVHDRLNVAADDGPSHVMVTPTHIELVDSTGRRLLLSPSGVTTFDARGHVVATLAAAPPPVAPAAPPGHLDAGIR